MVKFLLENVKNIIFLITVLGSVLIFGVKLYKVPNRVDGIEENVRVLQTKQEMFDLRFNNLEQNFTDLKADMKEIKSDIKLLLRTK